MGSSTEVSTMFHEKLEEARLMSGSTINEIGAMAQMSSSWGEKVCYGNILPKIDQALAIADGLELRGDFRKKFLRSYAEDKIQRESSVDGIIENFVSMIETL